MANPFTGFPASAEFAPDEGSLVNNLGDRSVSRHASHDGTRSKRVVI